MNPFALDMAVIVANLICAALGRLCCSLLSGWVEGKRARTQLQEVKGLFINNNKQNKQKQPRRGKKTGKLASWTRQDVRRRTTHGNEPTRNCKHKEIIKGANEEGNEGEQLGNINP